MIGALAAAINGLLGSSLSKTTQLINASTGPELQAGDFLGLSDKVSSNAAIKKQAVFAFNLVSEVWHLV